MQRATNHPGRGKAGVAVLLLAASRGAAAQATRSGRVRAALALPLVFLTSLVAPGIAHGAAGSLDPSFGTGGKVVTDIAGHRDHGQAVAIDSQGRIVFGGGSYTGSQTDFALVRYKSNGALDASFGGTGKVTTTFGLQCSWTKAVAIDSRERIVAAGLSSIPDSGFCPGSHHSDFALARYNPDGKLDTSFGGNGKVTTAMDGVSDATAVAIDSQGRIVTAGIRRIKANNGLDDASSDFALARYNPDGTLDTSFGGGILGTGLGGDGKVTTSIGTYAGAEAVAIDSQGRIVAAGYSCEGGPGCVADATLARYSPDGTLDTSFGVGGIVRTPLGHGGVGPSLARAVAIDSQGQIVTTGEGGNGSSSDFDFEFALARHNPDGALDTSFGDSGIMRTVRGYPYAVAIDSQGRIVAAGEGSNGSHAVFTLVRHSPDGTLDTSFGDDGKVMTAFDDFPPSGSLCCHGGGGAYTVAIDSQGRIVAGGYMWNGRDRDFALARYTGDATSLEPDPETETDPEIEPRTYGQTFPDVGARPLSSPSPTGRASDWSPLAISRLQVTRRFAPVISSKGRARSSARTERRRTQVRRGGSVRFRLSREADVAVAIERRARGIRLGRARGARCVRETPRNLRRAKHEFARKLALNKRRGSVAKRRLERLLRNYRCAYYARADRLEQPGRKGHNSVRLSGWAGKRQLTPGLYRAVVTATDSAGNASKSQRRHFRIVETP